MLPEKFTYPFCYVPHPLIREAAAALIERIDASDYLRGLFAEGKMMGALLVERIVSPHPIFKRQDTNIFSTVPISFARAALGGTIRIRTVDGEVEYTVKAGTQTDTRVRLRGKGVPSLRNKNVRGDHYVTLVVDVPTKLTQAQKDALPAFDDAMTGEGNSRKKGLFK